METIPKQVLRETQLSSKYRAFVQESESSEDEFAAKESMPTGNSEANVFLATSENTPSNGATVAATGNVLQETTNNEDGNKMNKEKQRRQSQGGPLKMKLGA